MMPAFRSIHRLGYGVFLMLFLVVVPSARAQEFNCSISVNIQNLSGSDFSFLQDLQPQMVEYMNRRHWTQDTFQDFERIECTMQLFFLEAISLTRFRVRLVIAMRRPIYGTSERTTVVQFSDEEWQFSYTRGTPLIFDIDRFDQLTSVIDFYAYLMLGYDYDTFSDLGGTRYFDQARLIAGLGRSSGTTGWSQLGTNQSRGELIAQLMDPRFRTLRQMYFEYHFEGLDHYTTDPGRARKAILGVLTGLKTLTADVSRAYVMDLFFSTKYQEVAAIFRDSPEKGEAFDILAEIDPAHLSEYTKIVQ